MPRCRRPHRNWPPSALLLKAARFSALSACVLICIFENRKTFRILAAFWTPFALTGAFVLCAAFENTSAGYLVTVAMGLLLLLFWTQESSSNRKNSLDTLLIALPLAASVLCAFVLEMAAGDFVLFCFATYLLALYGSYWAFRITVKLGKQAGCGLGSFFMNLPSGSSISTASTLDRWFLIGAAVLDAVVCCFLFAAFTRFLWPYITAALEILRS